MSTLRRSSSSYGGFADGILIRGMPLLTLYPGNIYWVDSNGGGGSKGTFNHPCLTLAAAHDLVTTDNGDIIVLKPGHAESYTATVDFSKSGFAVIGLGFGDNRPTFTINVAAAGDDMFDFAGDDIVVYNIMVKEGAGAGSAAVLFNVSGDNFHIEGCYIQMGTDNTHFITHDTTAKKGLSVVNNIVVGTATGPDACIRIEKTHLYAVIAGNYFDWNASVGIDTGVIVLVSGTTASGGHRVFNNVSVGHADGGASADVFLLQSVTPTYGGLCYDNYVMGADATDSLGNTPAGGFGFIFNMVTELGKGVPPTIDLAGVIPINTTPAV